LLTLFGVTAIVLLAALAGSAGVASANSQNDKYYICKYVGTPGVNERFQTGQNPIVVSANAIGQDPIVIGSYFNDSQGRSFVLAAYPQDPEPTVDDCPPPQNGSPTPSTPTPETPTPVVDTPTPVVDTPTPVVDTPTPVVDTPTPGETVTPFHSFQGDTASPSLDTPFSSFQGETSPPTGTAGGSSSGSTPMFALLISGLFGMLGLAAAQYQRRGVR
jgi:hypothetical protein